MSRLPGNGPVLVVGAGPSGLGFATELAAHLPVVLLDRIPVTGGSAGWEGPQIQQFTRAAISAGVRLRLGESALRWDGSVLDVVAPGRFERVPGRQLVIAAGLRPATAANLHIDGDRPAGVLPATVAEHLLQTGIRLWDSVAVLGDGPWAATVGRRARATGSRVISVGGTAADAPAWSPEWADEHVAQRGRLSIVGRDRVSHLRLHSPDTSPIASYTDIACDAVVLAAGPRPNRSVDGALLDPSDGVTFHQPVQPYAAAGRHASARAAARGWLEQNGEGP